MIKQYLKSQSESNLVDFVAVGHKGLNFASKNSEMYLGSVSNAVLRGKRMNCLFVA